MTQMQAILSKLNLLHSKLDGVGPVDNKPSTVTHDTWHIVWDEQSLKISAL